MIRSTLKVAGLLAGLAATLPLWADSPIAAPANEGAAMQGMRVVRDAKTGKLRAPNDAELKALLDAEKASGQSALRRAPAERLSVQRHANGMRSARLGPQSLVQMNASVDRDQQVHLQHANPAYAHPGAPASAAQE